jgi:hypothetical protein
MEDEPSLLYQNSLAQVKPKESRTLIVVPI